VWKNVNLDEPKDETLEKGLVPFGERFMRWKHRRGEIETN